MRRTLLTVTALAGLLAVGAAAKAMPIGPADLHVPSASAQLVDWRDHGRWEHRHHRDDWRRHHFHHAYRY